MKLLCCLPWTVAVALQTSSGDESWTAPWVDTPRKRITGPSCKPGAKARVVGGRIVDDPDRYPFLAWIGSRDGGGKGKGLDHFCGGTLVHPRVVMTAGHCLRSEDYMETEQVYVRFRLANFANTKGIERDVINWKQHEGYNRSNLDNDISLFLLDKEVSNDEVQPVLLSTKEAPKDRVRIKNVTVVGWGSLDEECKLYDTNLRDAQVPMGYWIKRTCRTLGSKVLRPNQINETRQLCAGYYKRDLMQYPGCGDSGGPLLTYDMESGNFTQEGLVSWSFGVPFPDVFTRVSFYRNWIDDGISALLEAGPHKSKSVTEDAPAQQQPTPS